MERGRRRGGGRIKVESVSRGEERGLKTRVKRKEEGIGKKKESMREKRKKMSKRNRTKK